MNETYEGGVLQIHGCRGWWACCDGKCAECTVNQTWTDIKSSDPNWVSSKK